MKTTIWIVIAFLSVSTNLYGVCTVSTDCEASIVTATQGSIGKIEDAFSRVNDGFDELQRAYRLNIDELDNEIQRLELVLAIEKLMYKKIDELYHYVGGEKTNKKGVESDNEDIY